MNGIIYLYMNKNFLLFRSDSNNINDKLKKVFIDYYYSNQSLFNYYSISRDSLFKYFHQKVYITNNNNQNNNILLLYNLLTSLFLFL